MQIVRIRSTLLSAVLAFALTFSPAYASEEAQSPALNKGSASDITSFVYFTGIGCPHCANVDPILLRKKVRETNLLVIEYEIYQDALNAPLMLTYNSQFGTGLGIPMIIADNTKNGALVGDTSILETMNIFTEKFKGNAVVLPTGNRAFASLSLADLPRLPKIWFKNRVIIKKEIGSKENNEVKRFLIDNVLPNGAKPIQETTVALSDNKIKFREAFAFGGWILMRD